MVGGMVELLHGLELVRERVREGNEGEREGRGWPGRCRARADVWGLWGTWRPCAVRLTHTELTKPGYSAKTSGYSEQTELSNIWFRIENFFLFFNLQN